MMSMPDALALASAKALAIVASIPALPPVMLRVYHFQALACYLGATKPRVPETPANVCLQCHLLDQWQDF